MPSFSAKQVFNSFLSVILLGGFASPGWAAGAPAKPADAAKVKTAGAAVTVAPVTEASKLIAEAYHDMSLQNWGFAVSKLCTALRYERNNVLARRYLAYSLLQSGNAKDAVSQLDALATLNNGLPFDELMRGEALVAMGDTDKAVDALRSALAMDPKSSYVRGKLISTLQSYGKYQDAAMVCSEAYFAAKTTPERTHYLQLFNTLQQQRAALAQRTLGMQVATTSSYPMYKQAPAAVAPKNTKKADTKAAAKDEDSDDDADAAAAAAKAAKPVSPPPAPTTPPADQDQY